MEQGEIIFFIFGILHSILFALACYFFYSEIKSFQYRRTPIVLFASSCFGSFFVLFVISFRVFHSILNAFSHSISEDFSRRSTFVLFTFQALDPLLVITCWRYLEIVLIEYHALPNYELVALNKKYGARVETFARTPHQIFIGHAIAWIVALAFSIWSLLDLYTHMPIIQPYVEGGVIVYGPTLSTTWNTIPTTVTYAILFIFGIFIFSFSLVSLRDTMLTMADNWKAYGRLGIFLSLASGIGILSNVFNSRPAGIFVGMGLLIAMMTAILVCEWRLKAIREGPKKKHIETGSSFNEND